MNAALKGLTTSEDEGLVDWKTPEEKELHFHQEVGGFEVWLRESGVRSCGKAFGTVQEKEKLNRREAEKENKPGKESLLPSFDSIPIRGERCTSKGGY